MAIGTYYICGYYINNYSIGGYWWLLMVILIMVIGGYSVNG
jgi:hypothetical protein